MIYLYREPKENEFCVIGADPAEGGDYSSFVVMSKYYKDVILVGKSKEESSLLGHKLNHIGRWINKKTNIYPSIAVERNTGSATIYVLKELNYPNLYKMPQSFISTEEERQEKYGWITSISSRPKMLDDLALAIRQKSLLIPSKMIIDELFTFIRNERTGKPQADIGQHDDLVMALAIAFQLFQTEPTPTTEADYSDLPDDAADFKKKYGYME